MADPEHAEAARDATAVPVLVLGGAATRTPLPAGVTDLEQIDPAEVDLPRLVSG
ncbi:MAG: hypothetical protein M3Y36_11440 [Actinomycetota bacterium]|nr:hypothetical protein [Actinomycetota bacterium]